VNRFARGNIETIAAPVVAARVPRQIVFTTPLVVAQRADPFEIPERRTGPTKALVKSASATHGALQQLASRGKDFTDNDLKEALVSLRKLEEDYAAAANRIAEAMSGNLRREMIELAVHAQNVGVEASARVATLMGDLAGGIGATPGLATIRGAARRRLCG
jgi:hypothetical protein